MRKLTALFSVIVLMVGILALPITSYAYWNHGKVRIVSRGEDLKVRIVERGEDFTIRWVDRNPGVGEWEEGPRLEDFTIRFVESGEDVKVRFVYH